MESSMPEEEKGEESKRMLRMNADSPKSLWRGKGVPSHPETISGPGDNAFGFLSKLWQTKSSHKE